MSLFRFTVTTGALVAFIGVAALAWGQGMEGPSLAPPPGGVPPAESAEATGAPGGEVLTRGALHEAFAQPVTASPTAGIIVPREPPKPIEELPPEAKPDGENIMWIPGYWNWDEERKDFIWVSGVWRAPPPGHQWVPGYWSQVAGGHQWVSGAWIPVQTQEVQYQPEPPKTLEAGATSPSPSNDHFWVPGSWVWTPSFSGEPHYVWRPGYWSAAYPGWVWVPAHYVWTPCGWIFVDGHWDYALEQRGLAFCPVYYARPVYLGVGFYYRPSITIGVGVLSFHFFSSPYYHHYYYGDYYDDAYVRMGIVPWYTAHGPYYDPLFVYYRWHYRRSDPEWEHKLHGWHDYYVMHREFRPAHTYAAEMRLRGRPGYDARFAVGRSFHELRADPHAHVRLASVSREQAMQIHQSVKDFHSFHEERARLESSGGRPGGLTPGAHALPVAKMPGQSALVKQLPPSAQAQVTRPVTQARAGSTAPTTGRPGATTTPGRPGTTGRTGTTPSTTKSKTTKQPRDSRDSGSSR